MHYSTIAAILLAATAAANPIASPGSTEPIESRGLTVTNLGLSPITHGDLQERDIRVTDLGLTPITDRDLDEREANIEKRYTGRIHSCGSEWMPINDSGSRPGFKSAVIAFCNNADGVKVPHNFRHAAQVDGLALTYHTEGYIIGQVYNRRVKDGYVISATDCINNLFLFNDKGAKCYGSNNIDTRGGKVDVDFGNWEAYPARL